MITRFHILILSSALLGADKATYAIQSIADATGARGTDGTLRVREAREGDLKWHPKTSGYPIECFTYFSGLTIRSGETITGMLRALLPGTLVLMSVEAPRVMDGAWKSG